MKITKQWIEENKACEDGAEWGIKTVGDGMELDELLPKFEHSDWLIWTLGKTGTPHRDLVKIACLCARRALRFIPDGEERPRLAIEAAERWAENPSEENRTAADAAAEAAEAPEAASRAAAHAAAYAAAHAAAFAAHTAAYAARAAAGAASAAAEHKALCAEILKFLKEPK